MTRAAQLGKRMLAILRDERAKEMASTPQGREELRSWRRTLERTKAPHQPIVDDCNEGIRLLNALLGEIEA
ncbi:MAG: hypothetical protein MK141_01800 [Pseudoxanthomonas sp.]|uniref:hypothetical protein n=1 Tax=Pseudoxanthomonas sp. TaxID=1871049 RepID=UPI0025852AEF|nr:hypothetical protein [Pseudoxanthomonas sp.]MCH2090299.1 hypothetical protein [Pseudoxanthomonas sp.]